MNGYNQPNVPKRQRGDLVEFDGLLAAVVAIEGDPSVPTEHVALWFGEPQLTRKSEGGPGGQHPILWTVPAVHCQRTADPVIRH